MIPALATLMFLMVLWMIVVLAVRTAAENGERITAAVGGVAPRVGRQGRRAAA